MNARGIALGALLLLSATAGRGQTSFEECEARLDAQPESRQAAECFYLAARGLGQDEEAARRLKERIARRPDAPWPHFFLGHVLWLARTCQDEAEAAYEAAASSFSDLGDKDGEIRARTGLAWLLARCGRFESAFEVLRAVEEDAAVSEDHQLLARIQLVRLRLEMRSGGNLEAVRDQLEEVWETIRQPAFDQRPAIWSLRRECLRALEKLARMLGKAGEAGHWIDRRAELAREAGDRREEAGAAYAALTHTMARDLPSAKNRRLILEQLRAVLPLAESADLPQVEALIRLQLAQMEGGREAESHLERCRLVAGELADETLRQGCNLALASHRMDGDPAAARRLLDEVSGGMLASADPMAWVDSWQDYLRVLWHTHSRDQAVAGAERVLAAVEALRDPQQGMPRLQLLDVWADPYYWLAGRLLEGATGGDDLQLAFRVMERLRAQELREILLLSGDSTSRLPLPSPDLLDEVVMTLGEDEAMISFQLSPGQDWNGRFAGGTWVLASTREGTRVHRLEADRVQIEPAVRVLVDQHDGEWAPEALASFYQSLLRPALDQLPPGIRRLTLIPDGILHLLPFAALRAAPGEPALGERYEISIEPSAALWLNWKRSVSAGAGSSALVLAAPEIPSTAAAAGFRAPSGQTLGALPHARREGRKVLDHLRGASRLLRGAEASEHFLKQADLRPYGLLHFATHAVADQERPWRSGVLLARGDETEDGWLQPEEIAELELDGKAVILSTCDSAAGGWLRGEGVMSLARAFFKAGAHAVVGTLRRLPDDQGERFFDDFYRYLSRGLSLREALAATQRRWLADGGPASTWANVVVLGNGDLVPAPGGIDRSSWRWRWWALGLAVLLAVALGLLGKKKSRQRRASGKFAAD